VNAPDDFRQLADWGVDGIFTDDPEAALQTIRSGT
jgi:glycerophosphoryl diester phosphodiesterase